MKQILFLTILFYVNSTFSQSNPILKKYYKLAFQSQKEFFASNYESSLKKYKDAFRLYPYKFYPVGDYIKAGCAAVELKQLKKGTAYFKKAIKNGGCSINTIKDQEGLKEILAGILENPNLYFKSKQWLHLVKKEKKITHKFFKSIDSSVYAKILVMYNKDQNIRKTTDGWTREIELVDSLNLVELKNIIRKHGWPGRQKIGSRGAFYSDLLLNHSGYVDYGFIMYLDPIVKKAVFEGNLRPFMYAFWVDRRQKMDLSPQLYGTCLSFSKPIKYQVELEDLDKRRDEIMLPKFDYWHKVIKNSD